MVYHPGAADGDRSRVQWRARIGGTQVATGTLVMNASTATARFDVPAGRIPARGELIVDARVGSAEFQGSWREPLDRGCRPLRTVAVGDSVVWGQGLTYRQKFPYLTGARIARATGRDHRHLDYSISGAVLDAPDSPPGNQAASCLRPGERQDPDRDGEMEFGEVTQQTPDVFCQLERAGAAARAGGYGIDLIILNGCINDLDPFLGIPVGITPGTADLPRAVTRECSGVGAEATNPAKNVPYFSGAKLGYGGRGMRAAIERAHALPGAPKVIVANFYYPFSRSSVSLLRDRCAVPGVDGPRLRRCRGAVGRAVERYEQYTQLTNEAYRQAAEEANAASRTGPYTVAADGLFGLDHAARAPRSLVFARPWDDPVYPLRKGACPQFSDTAVQCLSAAVAHPNQAGSRRYAEHFLLNPRVRAWFRLGPGARGTSLRVSTGVSGDPAGTVRLAATTPRAGNRYHWYFGDGTEHTSTRPVTSHRYHREGPYLPRLVVTDRQGRSTLAEAATPVRPAG
jgi:hypothetical protein